MSTTTPHPNLTKQPYRAWWFAKQYYKDNPNKAKAKNDLKRMMKYLTEKQIHFEQPPAWRPHWREYAHLEPSQYIPTFGDAGAGTWSQNRFTIQGKWEPRKPNLVEKLLWPNYYASDDKGPNYKTPDKQLELNDKSIKELAKELIDIHADRLFQDTNIRPEELARKTNLLKKPYSQMTEEELDEFVNLVADTIDYCIEEHTSNPTEIENVITDSELDKLIVERFDELTKPNQGEQIEKPPTDDINDPTVETQMHKFMDEYEEQKAMHEAYDAALATTEPITKNLHLKNITILPNSRINLPINQQLINLQPKNLTKLQQNLLLQILKRL